MISEQMQKALSEQLNHEFGSAYLYLAMSAYCSLSDFNGAATWMRTQHEEEQFHAAKLYDYLVEQGAPVALKQIHEPPTEFGSMLEVFEASLAHENEMTARLNELSNLALSEKDHATYNLLQWFVNEQVEEEASVGAIIAKLRMVKGDGYGLLMVDNELGQRAGFTPE
ncbi:MAG: ferritin [Acidimicrobiia bacterium]|nr:ferritin [Acidimicrobiia bacterium]